MEKGRITIEILASSEEDELEENGEFDDDCFILDDDCFIVDNCFILDDDLGDLLKKVSIDDNEEEDDDVSIIAERGQVANRDFPHSRHLCVKFPFTTTPHSSHCEKCYCYVCDTITPCKFWSDGVQAHCHATEHDNKWKDLRQAGKPKSSST